MKDLKQHILEKLKVSKNYFSDITLESLIKALKNYKDRKHYEYAVYIDLKEIFEEYPIVLQYHGHYTNIKGKEIIAIQFIQYIRAYRNYMKDGKDGVFIYFNDGTDDSVKIENTKELYDIFGEEAVNKIYDYIISH